MQCSALLICLLLVYGNLIASWLVFLFAIAMGPSHCLCGSADQGPCACIAQRCTKFKVAC